jgi:TetR/AcrR family transcriptional regulator
MSEDTRNKILEVSEQEFARDGYAGAHLQRIAERVGVQKTALYYYYDSKLALYEAVLARMLARFDESLTEAVEVDAGHEEKLDRLLDAINVGLAEHDTYSQILIRIFVDRVELGGETLRPIIEALVDRLLRFYKGGVESGVFVKGSARHFFQTLLGATVFHYASGSFGAAVLGVDDIFTHSAVDWRRKEVARMARRAILRNPPSEDFS